VRSSPTTENSALGTGADLVQYALSDRECENLGAGQAPERSSDHTMPGTEWPCRGIAGAGGGAPVHPGVLALGVPPPVLPTGALRTGVQAMHRPRGSARLQTPRGLRPGRPLALLRPPVPLGPARAGEAAAGTERERGKRPRESGETSGRAGPPRVTSERWGRGLRCPGGGPGGLAARGPRPVGAVTLPRPAGARTRAARHALADRVGCAAGAGGGARGVLGGRQAAARRAVGAAGAPRAGGHAQRRLRVARSDGLASCRLGVAPPPQG
jgi:hypothetical protein